MYIRVFFCVLLVRGCLGSGVSIVSEDTEGVDGQDTEFAKLLRKDNPLTLVCNMTDVLLNSTLIWSKTNHSTKEEVEIQENDRIKIFTQNSTLYIRSGIESDVGIYVCKEKKDSTHIKKINVITLGYKKLPKSTTVFQGDKLSLTCDADGVPLPHLEWFKEEVPIIDAVNATRLEITSSKKDVPNATIMIDPVDYSDGGNYVCVITSGTFRFQTTTLVRIKDVYAALWPFLGIVAEVVILCIIIFVYERRRIKTDFEESDTDKDMERKNVGDSHKDSELRHRK